MREEFLAVIPLSTSNIQILSHWLAILDPVLFTMYQTNYPLGISKKEGRRRENVLGADKGEEAIREMLGQLWKV